MRTPEWSRLRAPVGRSSPLAIEDSIGPTMNARLPRNSSQERSTRPGISGLTTSGGASLTLLSPGCRATIVSLAGGREFRQRLACLGILPGTEVTLLRDATAGPIIVEVRGSQLILGRGMAQRVLVKPLS